MKIVVIGGTGLIGSKTVAILRQSGYEVVPASPKNGVNSITGEGLKEAMADAQVVIDLANSPSFEDRAVLEFFETSGRNLLAAEAAARVRHHVALSIVGIDRSDNGYRWREMDSNRRFPVRIKHKDGAPAAGKRVSSSRLATGCIGRKGNSNSAPPLESIPPRNCFGTSDRAANGHCRSCLSGFGAEVRGFPESHTRIAAKVRTGSTAWRGHRRIKPLRRASILRAWSSQHGSGTGRHRQTFRWCRPGRR